MTLPVRLLLRPLCLGALMLVVGGCWMGKSSTQRVELEPTGRYIRYQQDFAQAYAGLAQDGGYDLVLSNGFLGQPAKYGSRIFPSVVAPISEVIHIRVAWRPEWSSRSDFPAATNSTIRWYVMSGSASGADGYVEYKGIGFVKIQIDDKQTTFLLQDVTVHPGETVGQMKDPLGTTRLRGKIRAANNTPAVREILEQLRRQIDAVTPKGPAKATEPSGMPPARTNVGP